MNPEPDSLQPQSTPQPTPQSPTACQSLPGFQPTPQTLPAWQLTQGAGQSGVAWEPTSDFNTTADLATLAARSKILQQVRQFFWQRDFWEVETPLLSQESVIDLYLEPIPVPLAAGEGGLRFLQTSPEFGMKRLLASGATAIFQIGKAFRAGECGPLHNPEFTMLEWYRCGDSYAAGRQLLSDLVQQWWPQPSEQVAYRAAFLQHGPLDPWTASLSEIRQQAEARGYRPATSAASDDPQDLERRDGLSFLWSECVEPHLGRETPTIVYDWPVWEAALAQTSTRVSEVGQVYEVAERFELYIGGYELANGYHELLSAEVLARRNAAANAARIACGKQPLPENRRLLSAMQHGLPACCGVALGVDRLVLTLLGKSDLSQVMAFPWSRA